MILAGPSECCADAMPQFVEYSLSPPRGPLCCVSTRKAWPMYIKVHELLRCMSIGEGQASGLRLVPEARLIRYVAGDNSASWPRNAAVLKTTAKTKRPRMTPLPCKLNQA